jgi:hypothetical protein
MKVVCWSRSSHRKCTFLWPGAKPFSMFLASSEDGVVRIDHVDDVKSYELDARVLGDAKTHRQGDDPDRSIHFSPKP